MELGTALEETEQRNNTIQEEEQHTRKQKYQQEETENEEDGSNENDDDPKDYDYNPNEKNNDANIQKSLENNDQELYTLKYEAIRSLTSDFCKTYSQVKNLKERDEGILSQMDQKEITEIIRKERQKLNRKQEVCGKQKFTQLNINVSKKRTSTQACIVDEEVLPQKRICKSYDQKQPLKDLSLAATLVENFQSLDNDSQIKILKSIDEKLNNDPLLFHKALKKQVASLQKEATLLFENREQSKLQGLLSSVSPMAAIFLHIQISLVNSNIMEEGNTLSQTLLPYLNKCTDYSFLPEKSDYVLIRYIQALIQHTKDTHGSLGLGFMILSLNLNPSILQEILEFQNNKQTLIDAFVHLGYTREAAQLMSIFPKKFLWPDLLEFFKGKQETTITEMIQILSKMEILKDPGSQIKALLNIFAYRRLFVDLLLKSNSINLSISKLIMVLENLKGLQTQTIIQCLEQQSQYWETLSIQNQSKEDQAEQKIPLKQLEDLFEQKTKDIKEQVNLQTMFEISKEISNEVSQYRHCEYQSTISAIVLSHDKPFIVVNVPTGSGKTWIQALISKLLCNEGKRIAIVEPNEILRLQTSEKVGLVDYNITICTIEWLYQYGFNYDIYIINEYDIIMNNNPYSIQNQMITGIWQFKGKKVIAFSATSSIPIERFVNNCIARPFILKFPSEYELIHGISPIQEGHIVPCGTQEKVLKNLNEDIDKNYDIKPIIIIYDKEQEHDIIKMIMNSKYRYFIGATNDSLQQIKDLDQGILLLLKEECRGVDTRFQKDSLVLIISRVQNYHEYQQMIGRSSRKRNVCEAILYSHTNEKPNQIMDRLKKQNITAMQDLEHLINVLEKKAKDKNLINSLKDQLEKGNMVKSLNELQKQLETNQFERIVKGTIM